MSSSNTVPFVTAGRGHAVSGPEAPLPRFSTGREAALALRPDQPVYCFRPSVLMEDARVIHESTPVLPLDDGSAGWRDTLVLTYRASGFLDPSADQSA